MYIFDKIARIENSISETGNISLQELAVLAGIGCLGFSVFMLMCYVLRYVRVVIIAFFMNTVFCTGVTVSPNDGFYSKLQSLPTGERDTMFRCTKYLNTVLKITNVFTVTGVLVFIHPPMLTIVSVLTIGIPALLFKVIADNIW